MELAQQARKAEHFGEAEKQFKVALKEARRSGDQQLQVAESLDGLAGLYQDQNKHAKSESLFRESLRIKETLLGQWHLNVAATLDRLGNLLFSQGKHDQAEPFFKRAQAIRDRALALHPDVYVNGVRKPVATPSQSAEKARIDDDQPEK
jgi:tetratricopeptide (TPR) repeat protein